MGTHYFNTAARVDALEAECAKWLYTPFGRGTGIPGVSVDCIHIVTQVYSAVGALEIITEEDIPPYIYQWSAHNDDSPLVDWLVDHGLVALDSDGQPQPTERAKIIRRREDVWPGDLVLIAPHRSVHHIEIALRDERLCGAIWISGVRIGGWDTPLPRTRKTLADCFQFAIRLKA